MTRTARGLISGESQAYRLQYVEWMRHASAQPRPPVEGRFAHAWRVARQAAKLLRERYRVKKVRVFGSLLHPQRFHGGSDIDLAVEGLTLGDYWDALTDVLFLDEEIRIDLVDPYTCPSTIWDIVEREGVAL